MLIFWLYYMREISWTQPSACSSFSLINLNYSRYYVRLFFSHIPLLSSPAKIGGIFFQCVMYFLWKLQNSSILPFEKNCLFWQALQRRCYGRKDSCFLEQIKKCGNLGYVRLLKKICIKSHLLFKCLNTPIKQGEIILLKMAYWLVSCILLQLERHIFVINSNSCFSSVEGRFQLDIYTLIWFIGINGLCSLTLRLLKDFFHVLSKTSVLLQFCKPVNVLKQRSSMICSGLQTDYFKLVLHQIGTMVACILWKNKKIDKYWKKCITFHLTLLIRRKCHIFFLSGK